MRSPEESYEEALGYTVIHEPDEEPLPEGLTPDMMEELHYAAQDGAAKAVADLRKLIARYPGVPALKNFLGVAHQVRGEHQKARKVEQETLLAHPDYLFAKLAAANQAVRTGKKLAEVPRVLGESLTLREATGGQDRVHISEWKNFYLTVSLFHARAGRLEHAEKLAAALKKVPGAEESASIAERQLAAARLEYYADLMKREARQRISVEAPPIPRVKEPGGPPAGLDPAVEVLYRQGIEISREAVAAIESLPRERAVSDLRKVLRDSVERGPYFFHHQDQIDIEESCFGLHAMFLLSDFKAVAARPEVFAFLEQHEDLIWEAFGDMVSWQPLIGFTEGDLGEIAAWLKRPGVPYFGRSLMSEAVAKMVLASPERRGEAVDFYREVLEFLRDSPPEDRVLDTQLVSMMVGHAIDIRADELKYLVGELFAKGYVEESMNGPLEAVIEEMESPGKPSVAIPDMLELYRQLRDRPQPEKPPTEAPPAKLEIGRNDPCPCGSGKKFKKCCLK